MADQPFHYAHAVLKNALAAASNADEATTTAHTYLHEIYTELERQYPELQEEILTTLARLYSAMLEAGRALNAVSDLKTHVDNAQRKE